MSPMNSRSFLITQTDAESLRVAAGKEGCTAAEFIRRAVAARVNGTTPTAGASLGTTSQLQAASAAFLSAVERMEKTNSDSAALLKSQIDRLNLAGGAFHEIAQTMKAAQS